MRPYRLDSTVQRALEDTGLPWRIVPGKKHNKLTLNGRVISILPITSGNQSKSPRGVHNMAAEVRRAARRMTQAA